jgi:hypothetical protein
VFGEQAIGKGRARQRCDAQPRRCRWRATWKGFLLLFRLILRLLSSPRGSRSGLARCMCPEHAACRRDGVLIGLAGIRVLPHGPGNAQPAPATLGFALEYNGKLAVHLHKSVAAFLSCHGDLIEVPHVLCVSPSVVILPKYWTPHPPSKSKSMLFCSRPRHGTKPVCLHVIPDDFTILWLA